MREEEREREK